MIGLLMKCYRLEFDLSLDEWAKELKLSRSTLHRVEKGKKIDIETYMIIHKWLFSRYKGW